MELPKLIFKHATLVVTCVECVNCLLIIKLLLDDIIMIKVKIKQIDILFNERNIILLYWILRWYHVCLEEDYYVWICDAVIVILIDQLNHIIQFLVTVDEL